MKTLKRILMATAFGDATRHVVTTATRLSREFGSELIPIHVIPDVADLPTGLSGEALRESATAELAKLREELQQQGVTVAEPIVAEGVPFRQIGHWADIHDVNVIVAGAVRSERRGHFGPGTTADRLLRSTAKPVWLVHPSREVRMDRILCAVDRSSHAARALRNALHLARQFAGQLTILHVVEPLSSLLGEWVASWVRTQADYVEQQTKAFEDFLVGFDFEGVRVERVVRQGRADDEILAVAETDGCGLVMLGLSGQTDYSRGTMGATTHRVLHAMPCSVVVVKDEHVVRVEFESEVRRLEDRYQRGLEMLEKGFSAEAVDLLQAYVEEDPLAAPAWEALANAHRRLGHEDQADACDEKADCVRETLWKHRVEHDARKQNPLWKGR